MFSFRNLVAISAIAVMVVAFLAHVPNLPASGSRWEPAGNVAVEVGASGGKKLV